MLETPTGLLRCCGRTLILRRRVQVKVPGHGAPGNHSSSRAWFAIHRVSSQASGTGPLDNLQPDQKLDGPVQPQASNSHVVLHHAGEASCGRALVCCARESRRAVICQGSCAINHSRQVLRNSAIDRWYALRPSNSRFSSPPPAGALPRPRCYRRRCLCWAHRQRDGHAGDAYKMRWRDVVLVGYRFVAYVR